MSDQTILCPSCGEQIPLTQALSAQVSKQLEKQLEQQKKVYEERLLKEKESVNTLVEAEKKKLWVIAQQKAEEKQSKELKELQERLKENAQQLAESEKNELTLRKKTRELEEKEKKMDLELARKMDEQRKQIVEETKKQEADQQRLKLQEKDKLIEIFRKQVDELKRKAEQGSMQIQGEVQEDDVKSLLTHTFVTDEISDIATGSKGADLLQSVNKKLGLSVGKIIWESKNAKSFSEAWITKLKQDQGREKADIAILISQSLPEDIVGFGLRSGIWVVDYQHCIPLVSALRMHLIELAKVKQSLEGRDEKMDILYKYLCGSQFRNRIENIIMAFMHMKQDLDTEKRSLNRIWSKREKEIEAVIMNTSNMYGDLQGIIGGSLPTIEHFELESGQTPLLEENSSE